MKVTWTFAAAVPALLLFSGFARASMVCTVPNTVTLDIIPAGCGAVLTNGPITFTGVVDGSGDIHNIEFDSILLYHLSGNSIAVALTGQDDDTTTHTVGMFGGTTPNALFQTGPNNYFYAPDTGTQNYSIAHFIDNGGFGGHSFQFKLNFGEVPGKPGENALDGVSSSADDTTSPGNFTVSSFFDIFTEISLDGKAFTLADDDFIGSTTTPGTGATFALVNAPEPATTGLIAVGLIGLGFRRRRRA